MNVIEIKQLILHNFKNIDGTVTYDLSGEYIEIYGDNGQGKTTLLEGIVWCLLGCDLWGNERATTRLINKNHNSLSAQLEICYNGNVVTIFRERTAGKNIVAINGVETTNSKIQEMFGEKSVLLSIFNPNYFVELTPAQSRQVLKQVLNPISEEEIFEELGPYLEEVITSYDIDLNDINGTNKQIRKEIKELEMELHRKDGAISQIQNNIDELEDELKTEDEINTIKTMREQTLKFSKSLITQINTNKKQSEQSKQTIKKQLEELEVVKDEVKKSIDDNREEIFVLKMELTKSTKTPKERMDKVNVLINYKSKLEERIKDLKESKYTVECNNCEEVIYVYPIGLDELELELEELEEEIEETTILVDKQIKEDSEYTKSVECKIKNIEEENNNMEQEIRNILEKEKNLKDVYNQNPDELDSLQEMLDSLVEDEQEFIVQLEKQEELEMEIEKNQNVLIELSTEKSEIEKEINSYNILIDALKEFGSTRIKKQGEVFDMYLQDVDIQLERQTQDGSIIDDFTIFYNQKQFNVISASEKIKCGLEIANMICGEIGQQMPVGIDNGESITKFDIPKNISQVITTKVKQGQKEIKVVKK